MLDGNLISPPLTHTVDSLRFKYLGGRNYIDIAQITLLFFESRIGVSDPYEMRDFKIRMRRPIRSHGILLETSNLPEHAKVLADYAPLADIRCHYAGQSKSWILCATSESIVETAPEPHDYSDERIQIKDGECYLTDGIGNFSTKTLMLMGKALICHSLPKAQPRVAAFHFLRPPTVAEIPELKMCIRQIAQRRFFILDAFVRDAFIGRVFVHK